MHAYWAVDGQLGIWASRSPGRAAGRSVLEDATDLFDEVLIVGTAGATPHTVTADLVFDSDTADNGSVEDKQCNDDEGGNGHHWQSSNSRQGRSPGSRQLALRRASRPLSESAADSHRRSSSGRRPGLWLRRRAPTPAWPPRVVS